MTTHSKYLAAAVQMNSSEIKQENLARAESLVENAARDGARLVVLPEFFNCLGRLTAMVHQAEPIPGPTSEWAAGLARRLGVVLVAGSIAEVGPTPEKAYNTSLAFDAQGRPIARYRKIHLFDVEMGDELPFKESRFVEPGDQVVATPTELGRVGQATCYDLRFPELFRRLVDDGAEVIAFPSAFAELTGRVHWEVLLRARAIENQVFIVAADQYGQHAPKLKTWGRSMIVDPWGTVLASADEGDAVVAATIDLERLADVRRRLPCLVHRRLGVPAPSPSGRGLG
jgi:predicted amidohydrolase